MDAGDLDRAGEWIDAYARWADWAPSCSARAWHAVLQAELAIARGDAPAARKHLHRALESANAPRQPPVLLRAHRLLGELDVEAGRFEHAERQLSAAAGLTQAIEDRYEGALTQLAVAGLQTALGQAEDARNALEAARTALIEIGAPPALERVERMLADLDAGTPVGLTAREIEVLRLVATGLTNAEIAGQLFISRHTVDHHLRSIYGKLGVPSRAAATRYALERQLA
jgi:ATP/maltotriose-dependent transcriptional regulator MalT